MIKASMNKLFGKDRQKVDPVSGNEVPAGALPEEVRDDVPARLSEGEFIFPADVVRYIGLDKLMKMRQQAKEKLGTMEEMGQDGTPEDATLPDDMSDKEFAEGGFAEGGDVNMNIHTQNPVLQRSGDRFKGLMSSAWGGAPDGQRYTDLVGTPSYTFQPYENAQGMVIFIPMKDGKPQQTVPEGYNATSLDEASTVSTDEAAAAAGTPTGGDQGTSAPTTPAPTANATQAAFQNAGERGGGIMSDGANNRGTALSEMSNAELESYSRDMMDDYGGPAIVESIAGTMLGAAATALAGPIGQIPGVATAAKYGAKDLVQSGASSDWERALLGYTGD
ncbi:MAG TPA: hypothetical protein V6D20_09290, partial [Candidatus Obscuribacterales bacterium]